MVVGDESSWLRMANQLAVLAHYQPLLTAPNKLDTKFAENCWKNVRPWMELPSVTWHRLCVDVITREGKEGEQKVLIKTFFFSKTFSCVFLVV